MNKSIRTIILILFSAIMLASCGAKSASENIDLTTESNVMNNDLNEEPSTEITNENVEESVEEIDTNFIATYSELIERVTDEKGVEYVNVTLADKNVRRIEYDALDLDPNYDEISALNIDISDEKSLEEDAKSIVRFIDGDIELLSGGVYVLKGDLNGGQIRIVDGFGERVHIILDNVNINTNKDCAILSESGARVLLRLADASINTIKSSSKSSTKLSDSAIAIKNDLSFTGEGQLNIEGNFDTGIRSDETITFISGTYHIDVPGDGVKSEKKVITKDGYFYINSGDEGFKVTDDEGLFFIDNGEFYINAKGKGFSSDNEIIILSGKYDITSDKECLEGKNINIYNGVFELKSNDDAINASDGKQDKKINQSGVYLSICGGEIYIDSEKDGIDTNGNLYLDGGQIYITGPTDINERIIDYNGDVRCKDVEMIAVGPSARMQDLGDEPLCNYIVAFFEEEMEPSMIRLKSIDDDVILSCDVKKKFSAAILTSKKIEIGKTYILELGDKELNVNVEFPRTEINARFK